MRDGRQTAHSLGRELKALRFGDVLDRVRRWRKNLPRASRAENLSLR